MSMQHRLTCVCILAILVSEVGLRCGAQAQQTTPGYSMPSQFPLYSGPPIQLRGNRSLFVTVRTSPDVLREMVPAPLVSNTANLLVVYVASLNIGKELAGAFNYLEFGIFVPVVFPSTKAPGNYVVCLYLNKAMPIVGGREIWGYPKKDAEIAFTEKDGEVSGRVERFGALLVNVSGQRQQKMDVAQDGQQTPFFLQKIIPSARKDAPPDVWQLVSSPLVNYKTTELWKCTAKLQLNTGPQDPLGRIKILEVVDAEFRVSDFVMDYGEILHDYLATKRPRTSR